MWGMWDAETQGAWGRGDVEDAGDAGRGETWGTWAAAATAGAGQTAGDSGTGQTARDPGPQGPGTASPDGDAARRPAFTPKSHIPAAHRGRRTRTRPGRSPALPLGAGTGPAALLAVSALFQPRMTQFSLGLPTGAQDRGPGHSENHNAVCYRYFLMLDQVTGVLIAGLDLVMEVATTGEEQT